MACQRPLLRLPRPISRTRAGSAVPGARSSVSGVATRREGVDARGWQRMSRNVTFDDLAVKIAGHQPQRRIVVAVAGGPGSGKSTFSHRLVSHLNETAPGSAALLPMDGYHYDDRILIERNLRTVKGAPETFDVFGLLHMLDRLRANQEDEIAVPVFDRDLEIARAGARIIPRAVRVVVVEGNYLLLRNEPWSRLHGMFDITITLEADEDVLRRRLMKRWLDHGFTTSQAAAKVEGNDLPNGRLVMSDSLPADFVLRTEPAGP